MTNFNQAADAIDKLRANLDFEPFEVLLDRTIRTFRSPRNSEEISGIKDRVYDDLLKKLQDGQTTHTIAAQFRKVVERKIVDQVRHDKIKPEICSLDETSEDGIPSINLPTPFSVERTYCSLESLNETVAALETLQLSKRKSDRRYFVAIYAYSNGLSVVEAIREEFGEILTRDNSIHVLARGRQKVLDIIKATKGKKAS